jgi:transcriptional regulator with XRE-family HTH domain
MKLAEKLKALREAKKMSQPDLAAKSGVRLGSIRNYEQIVDGRSRREPVISTLAKLARALDVDLNAFADCDDVAGDAPPKPPAKRKPRKK